MGLLGHGKLLVTTFQKKSDSSFLAVPDAKNSSTRCRASDSLPHTCWTFNWLDLLQSLCRRPRLLWVHGGNMIHIQKIACHRILLPHTLHVCNSHDPCSEDSISQGPAPSSGRYTLSASAYLMCPGPWPFIALLVKQCGDWLGGWDVEEGVPRGQVSLHIWELSEFYQVSLLWHRLCSIRRGFFSLCSDFSALIYSALISAL